MVKKNYFFKFTSVLGLWIMFLSLFSMVIIIFLNIIGRALFRYSLIGTIEIVGACSVVFISGAMVVSLRDHHNIKIDLLYSRIKGIFRAVFDLFNILFSTFAVIALILSNLLRFLESVKIKEGFQVMEIPLYPFRFILLISLMLLFYHLIKDLIHLKNR